MKLKHVKLFEEISQMLANRAHDIAMSKGENTIDDPLLKNKYLNQQGKFYNYVDPTIKKKLNEYGFGYHPGYIITWKKDMVVQLPVEAPIWIKVFSNKYVIYRGTIEDMDENTQRKLMRAIQYVQSFMKKE